RNRRRIGLTPPRYGRHTAEHKKTDRAHGLSSAGARFGFARDRAARPGLSTKPGRYAGIARTWRTSWSVRNSKRPGPSCALVDEERKQCQIKMAPAVQDGPRRPLGAGPSGVLRAKPPAGIAQW